MWEIDELFKIKSNLFCKKSFYFLWTIVLLGFSGCSTHFKTKKLAMMVGDPWNLEAENLSDEAVLTDFHIPIVSKQSIIATQQAIDFYKTIVEKGGWESIPEIYYPLKLGIKNSIVDLVRARLCSTKHLSHEMNTGPIFDSYVEAALRDYQKQNGLQVTGILDSQTRISLNIPAEVRLFQLRQNLDRLKQLYERIAHEKRYVLVNIPSTKVFAVSNGNVEYRFTAIVGQINRQTPLLHSEIYQVILNPTWTVPSSIVKKDLIPILQKDMDYLKENNIFIYNARGRRVSPELLDWNTEEPLNYTFRQEPGKNNAMSSTKINFYNKYDVYMHDTPEQMAFLSKILFESSGCIRVQNIHDLDVWLLNGAQGWTREAIYSKIYLNKTVVIPLKEKVPIHFSYITAWATSPDSINFRQDVYQKDGDPALNYISIFQNK